MYRGCGVIVAASMGSAARAGGPETSTTAISRSPTTARAVGGASRVRWATAAPVAASQTRRV
jgi:hypothetical protein